MISGLYKHRYKEVYIATLTDTYSTPPYTHILTYTHTPPPTIPKVKKKINYAYFSDWNSKIS